MEDVTVNMEYHITGSVVGFGIWMLCGAVIEKVEGFHSGL
jgi:hypothetical protein